MIFKSMGRKGPSYRQLLDYITTDKAVLKGADGTPYLITHNILGKTLDEMEQEFKENEGLRIYKRNNVNRLYHEIISWSEKDKVNLNIEKIEDIARQYIRERNELAKYVITIHTDKGHMHVHACVSGTEVHTGASINVSKKQFVDMANRLQEYEQNKFPELTHSRVDHFKHVTEQITDGEYRMQKAGKTTRKQEIKSIVKECYNDAVSKEDFYQKLGTRNLQTYERNGDITGVADNRNYRFATLGISEQDFSKLEKLNERYKELHKEKNIKETELGDKKNGGQLDEKQMQRLNELNGLEVESIER